MSKFSFKPLGKFFQTGTIRTRLLSAFVGLALLTAMVIGSSSSWLQFGNEQQKAITQLEAITTLKEAQVNLWVEDLELELNSAMREGEIPLLLERGVMAREQIREALRESIEEEGRFEEMFVLDQEGQTTISSDPEQEGKIHQQQAYFQEGLRGLYVQSPRYFPALGETAIVVAQPVVNENGQTVGVLAGRASLARLNEIMNQEAGEGDTAETYLVAVNRAKLTGLVAREGVEPVYVRSEGATTALGERRNGSGLYENYEGVAVVGVFHWLPSLEVALLAEQDQAEAFAAAYQTLGVNAAITGLAALVAIVTGLWVTRSIARPLGNLAEIAQRITAGDLELTAPVGRGDEIGRLAHTFNSMTDQLRGLIGSLEERVQERTRALEASAVISQRLTTILDVDEMLRWIVTNLQQAFGYYHVHIYLVNEASGELVMREGSGEVGGQLKAQGHRLPVGRGIVGGVAKSGQPFLAGNVEEVAQFVRNPLLPKTQAELAVPLRKGEKVLGVLDLQSEEVGGFDQEDLTLMQSVADQVVVAIENARLFQEAQAVAAESEALNRQLTREIWRDIDRKVETTGYVFSKSGTTPSATEWLPAMEAAIQQKNLVYEPAQGQAGPANLPATSLAIPLMLRGEVIGVIGIERDLPDGTEWPEDEVAVVRAVSEQVALALDAARLTRETERAAWRDHVVSESTAKVWSSAELEEVMKAAVAELGDKLQASEVVIRLGTEAELAQE